MYPFLPLDRQYDSGFGATADAFKAAADLLFNDENFSRSPNSHLASLFLLRHSIELYLKSIIIVIHRRLTVPYRADDIAAEPGIQTASGWKPLDRLHSLGILYGYLKDLVRQQSSRLSTLGNTDWSTFPDDLDKHIALIHAADERGTYFRYPATREPADDREKSSFKRSTLASVFKHLGPDDPPSRALFILDDDDNVTEAFSRDPTPLTDLQAAVIYAAEWLEGVHLGIHIELTAGF